MPCLKALGDFPDAQCQHQRGQQELQQTSDAQQWIGTVGEDDRRGRDRLDLFMVSGQGVVIHGLGISREIGLRVDAGKFRPEEQDLCGVVDPQEDDDERTRRAVGGTRRALLAR